MLLIKFPFKKRYSTDENLDFKVQKLLRERGEKWKEKREGWVTKGRRKRVKKKV